MTPSLCVMIKSSSERVVTVNPSLWRLTCRVKAHNAFISDVLHEEHMSCNLFKLHHIGSRVIERKKERHRSNPYVLALAVLSVFACSAPLTALLPCLLIISASRLVFCKVACKYWCRGRVAFYLLDRLFSNSRCGDAYIVLKRSCGL